MKKGIQPCAVSFKSLKILLSASIILLALAVCQTKQTDDNIATIAYKDDSLYLTLGNKLVSLTFDTLRNSLTHAIQSKGFDGAITFCNERVYSLTNTYADSVTIKRTALKVRNPGNAPDSLEQLILQEMERDTKTQKEIKAKLVRSLSGEVHYFKPILLQPMCLNCHGTPQTQIQPATLNKIKELYPNDQAIDFKEGDLRGIWHIIFRRKV